MISIKKLIVIVSFGSVSKLKRQQSLDIFLELISKNHPNYEVVQGFTSQRVIDTIKKNEGIEFYLPEQIVAKAIRDGYEEIIIQPLNIIAGSENEKIQELARKHNNGDNEIVKISKSLLSDTDSYEGVADAITKVISREEEEMILLVGHGSYHISDSQYTFLQKYLNNRTSSFVVGNLMGNLTIEKAIKKIKNQKVKGVKIFPLMITVGKHMLEDIGGEKEDSVKNMLIKEGFDVTFVDKSILEYHVFQQIYLKNIEEVVKKQMEE
ncbi:cobalamin biosynthesis Co2+ chelatase CbiK [Natranaerovirga pectinivora]|uniref:Cobalamin biosynthesis Co2+ chelatase CbiK n=1 Tax=Natranaerovirga pectinivora TaxID=682400 RepID=A0A4R3MMI5_9FIRM|nr:sirohydrochlorin cobaltochelatase [Natranaerovirga pectinivora]TCT14247.1 cobalamin biosynthesis Co2+ chelatase CbiK [Natranaerovirga pectinivora]